MPNKVQSKSCDTTLTPHVLLHGQGWSDHTRAGLFHVRVFLTFPTVSPLKDRQARHSSVPCFLPHQTPSGTWAFVFVGLFPQDKSRGWDQRDEHVCIYRGLQRGHKDRDGWQSPHTTDAHSTETLPSGLPHREREEQPGLPTADATYHLDPPSPLRAVWTYSSSPRTC